MWMAYVSGVECPPLSPVYPQDQGGLVCQAVEIEHNVKETYVLHAFRGLTAPKEASPDSPFCPFCWRKRGGAVALA